MYEILATQTLASGIMRFRIHAPLCARGAKPGQFCIIRIDEAGERIPLTLAGWDAKAGWIEIIVQRMGASTIHLFEMKQGDLLQDVCGPLGVASHLIKGRVLCVGGGVGTAVVFPQVQALSKLGSTVDVVIGARNKDMVILEDEIRPLANELVICTDDGSYGRHGFVTHQVADWIAERKYELVIAIGPVRMMQAVAELTRPYGILTMVSLNPIMIDGTGMCGCCRVEVGGVTRYACVDGPDFDGHQVNFDMLNLRLAGYRDEETGQTEKHKCRSGIHG